MKYNLPSWADSQSHPMHDKIVRLRTKNKCYFSDSRFLIDGYASKLLIKLREFSHQKRLYDAGFHDNGNFDKQKIIGGWAIDFPQEYVFVHESELGWEG